MIPATGNAEVMEERGAPHTDEPKPTDCEEESDPIADPVGADWVMLDRQGIMAKTLREFGCITLDIVETPKQRWRIPFKLWYGGTTDRTFRIAFRHPKDPTKSLTLVCGSGAMEAMERKAACVRDVLDKWDESPENLLARYQTLEFNEDLQQQLLSCAELLLEKTLQQEKAMLTAPSTTAVEVSTLRRFDNITLDVVEQKQGLLSRWWSRGATAHTFQIAFRHPQEPAKSLVLHSSVSTLEVMERKAQCVSAVLNKWDQEPEAVLARYQMLEGDQGLRHQLLNSADFLEQQERVAEPVSQGVESDEIATTGECICNDECPICLTSIAPDEAAMNCCGNGGRLHFFHDHCLELWIQSDHGESQTCPMCRGPVKFNANKLNRYLEGKASADLSVDARSALRKIADGLGHQNTLANMGTLERTAYASGMVAVCGAGVAVGWKGQHSRKVALGVLASSRVMTREQHLAYQVGLVIGVMGRCARMAVKVKRAYDAFHGSASKSSSSSSSSRRSRA